MNTPYVTGDYCAGFWRDVWNDGVMTFPPGARVLEVGCAENDWQTAMLAARPDLVITGIDWRRSEERPGQIVQGNVLVHDFPPASFDAIVAVSTVEHIGLGAYGNDPADPDGDTRCMDRCRSWLAPGGWMFLDVPYRPSGPYVVTSNYRAYDEDALQSRLLRGWHVAHRRVVGQTSGDGPYIALVLEHPSCLK